MTADAQLLRELGPDLLELLARRFERGREAPVTTRRTPEELAALFAGDLPAEGVGGAAWLADVERVLSDAIDLAHPRTVGHQVAPPTAEAALADLVVSSLNNSQAVWQMSPVGTVLERCVLGWFAERLGWPLAGAPVGGASVAGSPAAGERAPAAAAAPDDGPASGSFVSGGSVGNLTALAAARAAAIPDAWRRGMSGAGPAAIVASSAAHYCVERAAGVLGLGSAALVSVPPRRFRLDPDDASAALDRARDEGRTVVALVGCAGSTSTGSVDDLQALADVAAEHRVWLHVDAAHAGAFLLSERLRPVLAGLERAASLCIDLHKMAFLPSSAALVLVRRGAALEAAFQADAPYLFHGDPWDSGARTLQCTRRSDALKTWLALRLQGGRELARRQERTVATARLAFERVRARAGFEPLHEPETNILCFRHVPAALADAPAEAVDRHNARLFAEVNRSARAFLTSTAVDGRRWLRITVMNHRTGERELEELLDELERVARGAPAH